MKLPQHVEYHRGIVWPKNVCFSGHRNVAQLSLRPPDMSHVPGTQELVCCNSSVISPHLLSPLALLLLRHHRLNLRQLPRNLSTTGTLHANRLLSSHWNGHLYAAIIGRNPHLILLEKACSVHKQHSWGDLWHNLHRLGPHVV